MSRARDDARRPRRVPLGLKLIAGTLIVLAAVSIGFTVPQMQREREQVEEQHRQAGASLAQIVAAASKEPLVMRDYTLLDTSKPLDEALFRYLLSRQKLSKTR